MRVLVTGAAGSIGRVVTTGLAASGHDVVGLDLVPPPDGTPFTWHEADCADGDAVEAVFAEERLDAVVHLAGHPDEQSLPDSVTSHVVTTAALLDAMVEHDVRRLVYASSNHAVGRSPRTDLLTTAARPRPDTFYGVGKVAAEAVMSLYADRYGIDAVGGGHPVQPHDLVAAVGQADGEDPPDAAGRAGDQDAHQMPGTIRPSRSPMREAAARPASRTSAWLSGWSLMPAARLVTRLIPRTSISASRAAIASSVVLMPTSVPPIARTMAISAGVS